MKITKITLTNFRSFKTTQSIELAPVTLMFGPNSVGKSSVLMALAYVQQILRKGHCNPQKLDALGDKNIGGFRSLVHGQDTTKSIKIRIDFDSSKSALSRYDESVDELAYHIDTPYILMEDFGGNINTGAVEFDISWSPRHEYAYIKSYRVWINQKYIGCITSSQDLKNTSISELNTSHPLLVPYNHDDWLEHEYGEEADREMLEDEDYHTEFEEFLDLLNPNPLSTVKSADTERAGEEFVNRIAPISLICISGAIPVLGSPVSTNLVGGDLEESERYLNYIVIRQALSQAFVLPLDRILESIESSIMIGPLRVVPDSDYVANPHPEQADWIDGSAAWDLLYRDPGSDDSIKKLVRTTSDWFSSTNKLNTGYEVINESVAESLDLDVLSINHVPELITKRHVFFNDVNKNLKLSANQLGTGISQVLPLVVASNYGLVNMISIEQPELHIHPRFQVELADMFLDARKKHNFLIETHSEHLILRLLKRIRQTTDEELPEDISPVKAEDVSITYLEPSENGVITKRIRIDEDGEFVDSWPKGFFTERREELM